MKCDTFVDQTNPMPKRTPNLSQHVLHQIILMPARTQNVSQNVLTKPIPCQRGQTVDMKCDTFVDQTNPMPKRTPNLSQHVLHQITLMPARTQNVSQNVLTKPIPCQRGQKYINFGLIKPLPC